MPTKIQIGVLVLVIGIIALIGVISLKDEGSAKTSRRLSMLESAMSDLKLTNETLQVQLKSTQNKLAESELKLNNATNQIHDKNAQINKCSIEAAQCNLLLKHTKENLQKACQEAGESSKTNDSCSRLNDQGRLPQKRGNAPSE